MGLRGASAWGPSRNSFSWTILRVSRLLRGFYGAHHDLTLISRGFYAQNMGGGILNPYVPVCLPLGTAKTRHCNVACLWTDPETWESPCSNSEASGERARCVIAVLQLLYTEATAAEWLFPQEKATSHDL